MENRIVHHDANPQTEQEIAVVEFVRAEVERSLVHFGETLDPKFQITDGALSTIPHLAGSGLTEDSPAWKCRAFSKELQRALQINGFSTVIAAALRKGNVLHQYLTTDVSGVEVLIDPTIGQILIGHNHIFVGTKDQLRTLVFNESGAGKQFGQSSFWFRSNPTAGFELAWGNASRPVTPIVNNPVRLASRHFKP